MKVRGVGVGSAGLGSFLEGRPVPLRTGQQQGMGALLFGKRPPRLVDPRKYRHLKKAHGKLRRMEEQLAEVLAVPPGTFSVALCEGDNACVGKDGLIRFGVGLLEAHEDDDDLLCAILAHEMGHQPWTWPEDGLVPRAPGARAQMYREEEAKADRFAGLALGALGVSSASVERFLVEVERFEQGQSPDYYPAEVRARMISEARAERQRLLRDAGRFNPRALERTRQFR